MPLPDFTDEDRLPQYRHSATSSTATAISLRRVCSGSRTRSTSTARRLNGCARPALKPWLLAEACQLLLKLADPYDALARAAETLARQPI